MTGPIVDVMIPAFNAERDVVASINSIRSQTLRDIRIIIVNDGSTDRTGELIADLASEDPRVVLINQPNSGITAARNTILARCEAEFVACQDADDISFPDRLEAQVAFLRSHPDVVAIDGLYDHIDTLGQRLPPPKLNVGPANYDPLMIPSHEPYLMQPFAMFRLSAMRAINGYREVVYGEDADLYWRMLKLGGLHHMDRVLGQYRIHGGSSMGASALNARISAANSQLATLSYLRCADGREDITFSVERTLRLREAYTLDGIISVAGEDLDQREAVHFRRAVSAKLLELSLYRPYALDDEDYRTIARGLGLLGGGERVDTEYVQQLQARVAYQLVRRGRYACARMMKPRIRHLTRIFVRQLGRKLSRLAT